MRVRANNASGGGGWTQVDSASEKSGSSLSISGLTVGKTYHLFTTSGSGNNASAAKTNATVSASSGASDFAVVGSVDGVVSGYYGGLAHQTFKATATTATFTKSASANAVGYMLFVE